MTNNNEMMVTFENNEFGKLDILTIDGKSYFPAIKCAKILGYSNPRDAVLRHCKEDGVVRRNVTSVTTNQYGKSTEQIVETKYISEGNLYRLIIKSKMPNAKRFEDWALGEVAHMSYKNGIQQVNNNMMAFESEQFGNVRTVMVDGEPWFVAADVCRALEVRNPTQALSRLDEDEKSITLISNEGNRGNPNMTIINEPGLYVLALSSRKPEAKDFKRWITHEVLPALRKKGSYSMNSQQMEIPKDYPSALRALADQVESNQALVEQNAALTSQNKILSGEILKWDSPALLNAIIRKYGHVVCGDKFGCAWKAFYKELLYKHSINLESRKTNDVNKNPKNQNKAIYKYLAAEEWQSAIETAVALCSAADVDISDILKANIEETAIVA